MVSLLDLMFTVKNTKKGSNFFALFRFSTIFGWMFCSHIYLFLLYFCVRWMFCYHIYFFWLYFSVRGCFALRFMSTAKNTKKVTIFLHFFVVLTYLTKFFCCISWLDYFFADRSTYFLVFLCWMDVLHPRSTFLCCISLFDGCFAVKFTSTMKNKKKGSNVRPVEFN